MIDMAIRIPNSQNSQHGAIVRVDEVQTPIVRVESPVRDSAGTNEEPRVPQAFKGINGVVVLRRPRKNAGLAERHAALVRQGLDPNVAAQRVIDEGPAHLKVIRIGAKRSMRRVVAYSAAILLAYGVVDFTAYQTGFGQIGFLSLLQSKLGIPKIADFGKSYFASDLDSTEEFIKKYGNAQNTVIRICKKQDGLPSISIEKAPGSGEKITASKQKDFRMLNELAITSPATPGPGESAGAAPSADPLSECVNDINAAPTTTTTITTTTILDGP